MGIDLRTMAIHRASYLRAGDRACLLLEIWFDHALDLDYSTTCAILTTA